MELDQHETFLLLWLAKHGLNQWIVAGIKTDPERCHDRLKWIIEHAKRWQAN